ncbi:peroxisomal membrane protein 11A [Pholidichthys leucotaenia]
MDAFVKLTSQSQGKDRILRAMQNACALSMYLLRNRSERKELVAKLQSLQNSISSGRKLLRLGNAANSIEAAKRTVQLADKVLRLCLTAANINRALYLICDNALWAGKVGLVRSIDKERWSLNASRFYLFSVVLHLTRDVYATLQLMTLKSKDKCFKRRMDQHLSQDPEVAQAVIPQLDALLFLLWETLKCHPAVALDTLRNICDLFGPLDKLSIYHSNAGLVGFCGLISSLIGIVTVLQPTLRIAP